MERRTETESEAADTALLQRFVRSRDEDAFAALVQRHGPMVLGICRRILRNHADAEDAFQATFIVLSLKAHSIRHPNLIANWLFGVATRVAGIARRTNSRRVKREGQSMWNSQPSSTQQRSPADAAVSDEAQKSMDEEINRLPDKYRKVIIACYLQGMTKPQAAAHLNWPEGSVATRLGQARELLRKRMTSSSPRFTGEDLTAALAPVLVPPALLVVTLHAAHTAATGTAVTTVTISANATALTKGALKMMFVTKLKIAAAIVIASAVTVAGTTAVIHSPQPQPAAGPPPLTTQPAPKHSGDDSDSAWSRLLTLGIAFDGYWSAHNRHFPPDLGSLLPYLGAKDRVHAFFTPEDEKALQIPNDLTPQWIDQHTSWIYLGTPDMAIKLAGREQLLKDATTIYIHSKFDARHGFVWVTHLRVGGVNELPRAIAEKEIEESKRKLDLLRISPTTIPATTKPVSAK